MTDSDFITRAELERFAEHLTAEINRALAESHAGLTRHYSETLSDVMARYAATGAEYALEVARTAATEYTRSLTDQLHVTINVPEAPAPVVTVENSLELPARKTTTTVERDNAGLITKTTATESDVTAAPAWVNP